jgi:hypothetical protein
VEWGIVDVPTGEKRDKFTLELCRKVGDVTPCILAHNDHLSQVGLGRSVHLEGILVAALLLADLAIPTQTLQAL